MAENKTRATEASVESYLSAIEDETRRTDCEALARLITKATKQQPKMWGRSIVGFGSYHYKYESGREGDSYLTGFSSRKGDIRSYGNGFRSGEFLRTPWSSGYAKMVGVAIAKPSTMPSKPGRTQFTMSAEEMFAFNPRLQRTRLRAPLSRKPLGRAERRS